MQMRMGFVVGLAVVVGWAASAHADVLCVKQTKKGALKTGGVIARPGSTCKKKEKQIDKALGDQLGIRGDRGPGLAVVDKNSKEVGIPVGSYYGTATVAFESSMEWFTAGVNGDGFSKPDNDFDFSQSFFYDDASCANGKFLAVPSKQDSMGNLLTPPTELSHSVFVDPAGTTGYFARASEGLKKQLYRTQVSTGGTAQQAQQNCTFSGGTAVGTAAACPEGHFGPPGTFCVKCCRGAGQTVVGPVHTVDLSGFTGPLTFSR